MTRKNKIDKMVQTSLMLPQELLDVADSLVPFLNTKLKVQLAGVRINRSAVLRFAIDHGLKSLQAESGST